MTHRTIADEDALKVAKWFYEELLSKKMIDADSIPHSLDMAISKLRSTGVHPTRWLPFVHMGA